MSEQPPVMLPNSYWLQPPILKKNEATATSFFREKWPPSTNIKDIESYASANLSFYKYKKHSSYREYLVNIIIIMGYKDHSFWKP